MNRRRAERMKILSAVVLLSMTLCTSFVYSTREKVVINNLPKANELPVWQREKHFLTASPFLGLGGAALSSKDSNAPQGFPTPPGVPAMPGTIKGKGGGIVVVGVLPPTVAIVRVNGGEKAVRLGDRVGAGIIDEITQEGIVINEHLYSLKTGGK